MKDFVKSLMVAVLLVTGLSLNYVPPQRPHFRQNAAISAAPTKVIISTDIAGDVDDPADLGVAAGLQYLGQIQIVGVITNSKGSVSPYSLPFAKAILSIYYQLKGITYGAYNGSVTHTCGGCYNGDASAFAQAGTAQFNKGDIYTNYDNSTTAYRKILHSIGDGEAVIINTGFMSDISDLLDSSADGIDSRNGVDLVTAKVKKIYWVAGNFGATNDPYNVGLDIVGANNVMTKWPTTVPFIWDWTDLGVNHCSGPPLTDMAHATQSSYAAFNPVRYAFYCDQNANKADSICSHTAFNQPGSAPCLPGFGAETRSAWAQTSLLHAAIGYENFFSPNVGGGKVTITQVSTGVASTVWGLVGGATQEYLVYAASNQGFNLKFNELLAKPATAPPSVLLINNTLKANSSVKIQ